MLPPRDYLTGAYEDIRPLVEDGDVFLVKRRAIASIAIRALTAESYNHVAMLVWIQEGLWCAEMREKVGYRLTPASEWITEQEGLIWWGMAPPMARASILRYVLDTRSVMPSYGWRTLLRVWWSQVRGKRIKGKGPVCSTYIQAAWEAAGYQAFDRLASPGIIGQHCRAQVPVRP